MNARNRLSVVELVGRGSLAESISGLWEPEISCPGCPSRKFSARAAAAAREVAMSAASADAESGGWHTGARQPTLFKDESRLQLLVCQPLAGRSQAARKPLASPSPATCQPLASRSPAARQPLASRSQGSRSQASGKPLASLSPALASSHCQPLASRSPAARQPLASHSPPTRQPLASRSQGSRSQACKCPTPHILVDTSRQCTGSW